MASLARVHLITTGGTIAGIRNATRTVVPGLSAEEILVGVPSISSIAALTTESFLNIPSHLISLSQMLELAVRAKAALSNPGVAGVVITHGAGTLEQTAYFLDTVLGEERPLVLTGAMRNPTLPSNDGPVNLLNAVQVAACPRSCGLGVLVVMGGVIHCARDVTKTHFANTAAFQSPEFGPLGAVDEDYVFYARRPYRRLPAMMPADITARVERVCFSADSSDHALRAAIDADVDGLVVEAARLTPRQLGLVTEAVERGLTVVCANPYQTGRLNRNTYRHEGAEAHLWGLGVTFSGTSGLKARIKLTVLLSARLETQRIREVFHAEWQ